MDEFYAKSQQSPDVTQKFEDIFHIRIIWALSLRLQAYTSVITMFAALTRHHPT